MPDSYAGGASSSFGVDPPIVPPKRNDLRQALGPPVIATFRLGQMAPTIVSHAWNDLDLGDEGDTIAATVRNRINSAAARAT